MRGEKNVKDTRRNFPFEIPTIPSVAIVLLAPLLFEHSRLEINKIAQRNVISSPRRDDLIGPCYWSILDFSIITRDGSATRPQTERERDCIGAKDLEFRERPPVDEQNSLVSWTLLHHLPCRVHSSSRSKPPWFPLRSPLWQNTASSLRLLTRLFPLWRKKSTRIRSNSNILFWLNFERSGWIKKEGILTRWSCWRSWWTCWCRTTSCPVWGQSGGTSCVPERFVWMQLRSTNRPWTRQTRIGTWTTLRRKRRTRPSRRKAPPSSPCTSN